MTEKTPRVLFVSPVWPFPETRDGVAKILFHLLQAPCGYRPALLCLREPGTRLPEDPVPSGLETHCLPFHPFVRLSLFGRWLCGSLPYNATRLQGSWKGLTRWLLDRGHAYDYLHFFTPWLLPVIDRLPPELRIRVRATPIDSMTLLTRRRLAREPAGMRGRALRLDLSRIIRYERRYYSAIPCPVFVSAIDAELARTEHGAADAIVIANGVDCRRFLCPDPPPESGPAFLFTGNYGYAPNRDAALHLANCIYPALQQALPNASLRMVGPDPPRKLPDRPGLTVVGFVPDIVTELARCHIYLSPLRYGSGIKNKVLEAMAAGRPVIGSPLSFEGIAGRNGVHFLCADPDRPETWLRAVEQLRQNPGLYRAMVKSARHLVMESHSWDNVRRQYERLYAYCPDH